jgi:hypothetical protein
MSFKKLCHLPQFCSLGDLGNQFSILSEDLFIKGLCSLWDLRNLDTKKINATISLFYPRQNFKILINRIGKLFLKLEHLY